MHITKMHGLGNDFIVIEERELTGSDVTALARTLCARRLNVGADGLLLVDKSDHADVRMRIINSDGSEAEMCGNGIRCFARYVYDKGIVKKAQMDVETLAGVIRPELVIENGKVSAVRVDMGKPSFDPQAIPVLAQDPMDFEIETAHGAVRASSVLMGVPHTIVFVEDMEAVPIEALGREIETHALFPRRTNVDFIQVLNENTARMETWERGAGRTLACGTGATAAGVVMYKKGIMGPQADIRLFAGTLHIDNLPDGRAMMTGAAEYVFDGETK
ncbi:MAG: diaminopimelate epimerase [Christensenella sp.]|uniref:diaminopimelate epimerase n=1 Tax=Christensenella sp. TaxID=1935934 RepID=UPI002B1F40D4|nr:diaminopimelate epimerase [Christensenella sp.]MEA5002381.1 diaminopimelate epimerase [Christensenella sp.]